MIPRIFGMLSRFVVEIHTLPVHLGCSLDILLLKYNWGLHSYRCDAQMAAQIFGIHPVYQETFLHIHRLLHQLRILRNWILLGGKLLRNRFTCLQRRKVKDQNKIEIWDASLDRQPKIQSSSVEETSKNYLPDQQRLRISGSPFWQVPYASNLCLLEDKIQDRGMYLFTISYGSDAMDQGSGVGWFSGWIEIFVIYSWYFNA